MTSLTDCVADFQARTEQLPAARRFTDAELEALYAVAFASYRQGRYGRAASQFGHLALYRPTSARFLKGQGASQFMAMQYAQSAATYAFLILLRADDADALCLYGHSLLMLGDKDGARRPLRQAATLAGAPGEFRRRARALLELIAE